ncbi:uncharacterized protein [Venturia canescens]|uniref:uncharacterized protein n=1 Tax=Venturia canescens TaxID=32260 RepID=UPI001C9BBDAD|nr:uncharacterized protein LOC122407378 [Venturia canescens]
MLKLAIIAAILACTEAYYNHGAQPYYSNYGHAVNPAPIAAAPVIPVNPHHAGNVYNHGYGNFGGLSSHGKIIEATYPGAVHKSAGYAVANPTGYHGSDYVHGPSNAFVHQSTAISGQHAAIPYNHPAPVPIAPSLSYNHATVGNYAHSRYAVTEGPNYVHSRYSISNSPALSYGHARYSVGLADSGIQKIGYNPGLAHMGYPNHVAQNYAW